MRLMVRWLAILTVLLAAACESGIIEPAATPPSAPTATDIPVEPSVTPNRQPLAEATAFFGRSVSSGRNAATLRITHTAEQAPALDIYLDGAEYARRLGQGLSTGLTPILPGSYVLHVEPRGEDIVLAETPITLVAGRVTDVIVVTGEDGLQLVVIDGPEETVEPGMGIVRTVNALSGESSLQAILNGSAIPDPMAAGEAHEPFKFEQGDLDVTLQVDGADILSETRRVRDLSYMLLIVTGTRDRPQVIVQEAPLLSRYSLRVINVNKDVREIDVYFDNALVASSLGYGSATERTVYANAPTRVSVHAANADLAVSTPLLDGYTITPRAGSDATLAIYGTADGVRAMWIEQDLSPVPVGYTRTVFAHVLPGVTALRAGVNSDDLEGLQPFAYGSASMPTLFSAGDIRLFFRDSTEVDRVVELRQSVPIEAAQSIVYFVTGAAVGDETPPLILGEAVAEDENLSADPSEPVHDQYRVRFVNAIASQPLIDIEQEDQPAASNLWYGEGTELITVNEESVLVNAHISSSGATLIDERIGFPRPGDYTIYIYGSPENGIAIGLIYDSTLPTISSSEQAPTVRLVNLTQDSSAIFGLALSTVRLGEGTPVPTLQPIPTAENLDGLDLGRRRLPMGMPIPIAGVEGIGASRHVRTQTRAETYVINRESEIIAEMGIVEYETGRHTDIVVYEYRTEDETLAAAFALVYPTR